MKYIVVDASVAIKWFLPEIHTDAAKAVLNRNARLLAPDLIFSEMGNILWKKTRKKELTNVIAHAILNDFKKMPFEIHESEILLDKAWKIASLYDCSVYDSLYVALAETEKSRLVTADKVLYNRLKKTTLEKNLLWVEDTE